jgi:hypothetical protein
VSDPSVGPSSQRLCTHALQYQRLHAGFSNEGYLYCDRDDTVLTWGTYNPHYTRRVDALPWMLTDDEKSVVESAIKPCPCGGRFAFANPPRCPYCHLARPDLVLDATYFVVVGRRLDGDTEAVWVD